MNRIIVKEKKRNTHKKNTPRIQLGALTFTDAFMFHALSLSLLFVRNTDYVEVNTEHTNTHTHTEREKQQRKEQKRQNYTSHSQKA